MVSSVAWLGVVMAAAFAALLYIWFQKQGREIPAVFFFLYIILPFAGGGFHAHVITVASFVLVMGLAAVWRSNGQLQVSTNMKLLSAILLFAGYALTPLWAGDKGMSLYGLVRYFPIPLLVILHQQYPRQKIREYLQLVPCCGVFMTVLSCILMAFPDYRPYLTVYSRLSGFMQYPNTFAAFLLSALILNSGHSHRTKISWVMDGILILGILLSGSRTCFILLLLTIAGMVISWGKTARRIMIGAVLSALVVTIVLSRLPYLEGSDRFFSIDLTDSSFLLRFLYWKDAWGILLDHPFGTGYLGYRSLVGMYQTGRYRVTFVHNGLLQLILDTGWILALMMAATFLKTMVSRKTSSNDRLLLVMLLAHCMFDFDLQFLIIWVLVLSVADEDTGKAMILKKGTFWAILCSTAVIFSAWLGMADFFYSNGKNLQASRIMPVHTDALVSRLEQPMSPEERKDISDKILLLDPNNAEAWGGKADAAMAFGHVKEMVDYKKQMIRCNPFEIQEYYDYFRKLYQSMQTYLKEGDTVSAAYCANRLLEIPVMLEEAEARLDSLDKISIDDRVMSLPVEYQRVLNKLALIGMD